MKRVYLFLIVLFSLFFTINVNAYSITDMPDIISSEEGIDFYLDSDGIYSALSSNDVNQITLKLDVSEGTTVEGSKTFLLNDGVTIHNVKFVVAGELPEMEMSKVVSFKVTRQDTEDYSLALDDLKVVGFNIKYNKNKTNYEVKVPSNLKEVYVYAKAIGNSTTVSGDGLVNLVGKSTNVIVNVYNPSLGSSEYVITIVKKNYILTSIIITSLVFLAVIGVLLYLFKKYKDKVSNIDINVLNKGVENVDVSAFLNKEENKGINDIANENIKKGVVEATPDKEENK